MMMSKEAKLAHGKLPLKVRDKSEIESRSDWVHVEDANGSTVVSVYMSDEADNIRRARRIADLVNRYGWTDDHA